MINPSQLQEIAKKWQKRLIASKGHFVFYTADKKRFEVSLKYLCTPVFQELLRRSEDEFGSQSNNPLTLPCNSVFMEHLLKLLKQRVSEDEQKELLDSISRSNCRRSSSEFLSWNNANLCQRGIL
ncbi:hypothetical protein H6P81_017935 [Aristolochia fimbriata]|uniref:Small auxin up regulated protein n=1 Tax=Aristolochia fimbriata TaxID=158543 RepID=A0AAV7E2Q2_ARIFI|nr:hypothetical protein H6P81_017935 [Aristolochia fimbriata]